MQATQSVVLAADVGGTNTKLALARCASGRRAIVKRSVYPSRQFAMLEDVIDAFLREPEVAPYVSQVATACLAVAGPVENGRARLTNLPWQIDEAELGRRFRFARVSVINDFAAAGLGIDELAEADFLTLQAGTLVPGADRIVIGAGTGLGVAWLVWSGERYVVHPSEGGHADFGPVDALQDELLVYLRGQFGRVSYERVLCGSGLTQIFSFLRERGPDAPTPALLQAMGHGDPAAALTDFALSARDALAMRTLDLFAAAYGAFAGNVALMGLAHGGIYVAGGIAPRIADKLQDTTFMGAFTAKGRFQAMLESISVKIVMNDQVGLLGAVAEAARLEGGPAAAPRLP